MIFYLVVLLVVVIFCAFADKANESESDVITYGIIRHTTNGRLLFAAAALILILVAGLRFYVGSDYGGYYTRYRQYASSFWERLKTFDEPGFSLIASIALLFSKDGAAGILLASVVTIGLETMTIYRHTDRLMLTIVMYVFIGCWHGTFNGVRQYLAVAVLFSGMRFLQERSFWKYLLIVCLASLCHRSAVITILLYFVVHRKISIMNLVITMLVTWLILVAYERLFTIAEWVLDKDIGETDYAATSVNVIRIVVTCMPAVFFLLANANRELTEGETFYLNIMIVYASLTVMTMQSALLQRVVLYLAPMQALAIPQMLKTLKRRVKPIMTVLIVLFYLAFWMYELSVRSTMIPYKTIFIR